MSASNLHAKDTTSRLEAALAYAELGWPVVPARGKAPVYTEHGYRDATTSRAAIEGWWRAHPDANIAVALGPSSGLFALDIDARYGGIDDLDDLISAHGTDWTHTTTNLTGARPGQHLLYQMPTDTPLHTTKVRRGIEALASKCILLPPSVHPVTGRAYAWESGFSPWEYAPRTLPRWLLDHARATERHDTALRCEQGGESVASNEILLLAASSDPTAATTQEAAGRELTAFFCDEAVVRRAWAVMGFNWPGLKRAFHCVLPRHDEARPSAALYPNDNGLIRYIDFHQRDGEQVYLIAEVYASLHYRETVRLRPPERAVWSLRLLVECGVLPPARVALPPLPSDATPGMRQVHHGLRLLFGCRWLHTYGDAAPCSWRFLSAWCGVHQKTAQAAMERLLARGIITRAGEHRTAYGKATSLFLPGGR